MKKNRLFVLGLVTVFVALVSLTFVSSTWAKYTTTAAGSDSARVAYWGFKEDDMNAALDIEDLFRSAYGTDVEAAVDVIAPGTTNEVTFKLAYTGGAGSKPEVDYTYTITALAESSIAPEIESNKQIIWSLDGVPFNHTAEKSSWKQLLEAIEALDGTAGTAGTAFEANSSLPDQSNHTVRWEWVFSEDPTQSEYDTFMGNSASALNVVLAIRITAEQVNE